MVNKSLVAFSRKGYYSNVHGSSTRETKHHNKSHFSKLDPFINNFLFGLQIMCIIDHCMRRVSKNVSRKTFSQIILPCSICHVSIYVMNNKSQLQHLMTMFVKVMGIVQTILQM